jgi:hypothetical protein
MVIQALDVAQQVERRRLPPIALPQLGEMSADRVGLQAANSFFCSISGRFARGSPVMKIEAAAPRLFRAA